MIVFNDDGCIKCGACEGACPSSAIEVTSNKIIHCDTCGDDPKCAEICPNGALQVEYLSIEDGKDDVVRLVFNGLKCDKCGKCIDVCPQGTIALSDNPKMPVEGFCVMCQQCVDVCPVDVIGIDGIKEPKTYELNIEGAVYINGCVGCGTCVGECPVEAISLDNVGDTISINQDVCIKCGVCSQTCPWNAVYISEKIPDKRAKEIKSFDLDKSKCIGCNTCLESCPGDFIKAIGSSLVVDLPNICAACGLCEKLCPVDAISLDVVFADPAPANDNGIALDKEKCDHIGACAMKCPTQAIRVVTKTGMQVPDQVKSDLEPSFASCIRCGACAASCPNGALSVDTAFEVEIDGESQFRDRLQFNPSKCDQCGDCVKACPYNMIKVNDNPKLPIVGFCTLCGQCIEACPENALCYK